MLNKGEETRHFEKTHKLKLDVTLPQYCFAMHIDPQTYQPLPNDLSRGFPELEGPRFKYFVASQQTAGKVLNMELLRFLTSLGCKYDPDDNEQ